MRPLALVAAIASLFAANASATVLFSTLGQPNNEARTIGSPSEWWASDFTTGSLASSITSISVAIGNFDSISHSFGLELYSDSGGSPDSLVGTFSPPTPGANTIGANTLGSNNIQFSHAGASLSPTSTYWVVLKLQEAIVTDSPYWWLNYGDGVDNEGGFTSVSGTAPVFSDDGGATWVSSGSGNFRMEIIGTTAVPEPSRVVLAIAGLFVLGFRRRR